MTSREKRGTSALTTARRRPWLGWLSRLGRPGWLLVALALASFALLEAGRRLEAVRHPDTPSYFRSVDAISWVEALSHYRSYGYPLFLKTIGRLGLTREAIPEAQTLLFFASVLFFFVAVRRWARSPWIAFAAATPLLWAPIAAQSGLLQPDFLAAGVTLAAVSCLLFLAAGVRSFAAWAGLAVAVFVSYQLRPATVFLIAWIPAIGWLLRVAHQGIDRDRWGRILRWTLCLAALTVLPYFAFATLRWTVVGHFGLVPFGGANLSALTANLLDPEVLQSLPNDQRQLGRGIYRSRQERGWTPLIPGGATHEWFAQYNETLWRIAYPAAWDRLRSEKREGHESDRPDHVVVNERLSKLARATIARRPLLYLQWVRDACLYGLGQLGEYGWIRWPFVSLLLAACLAWLFGVPGGSLEAARLPLAFALLAVSFLAVHLFLVAAVSFPFQRYMRSIVLFLPSALCVLLWEAGRLWVAAARRPPE